jgi:alcohol dehydrogenase
MFLMTKKTSRAAVLMDYGRLEIQEFPLPEIGPREGLLRVEMAGVCGTDPHWYHGRVKLPALPLILGHEILGRIAAIGPEAAATYGVKVGDRVVVEGSVHCDGCYFCNRGQYHLCDRRRCYGTVVPTTVPPGLWGGYSEYLYLAPGSMVHRVAEKASAESLVLVCAVVANGIRWMNELGGCRVGDTVVIQGVGPQGLALIIAAREAGASLIIATGLTKDGERMSLAREYGADVVLDTEKQDVKKEIRSLTGGRMADIVVDVTGSVEAILASLELVRKQGTFIPAGLTGTGKVTPLALDYITINEIRLQGVFAHTVGSVDAAVKLAEKGKYPLEKMVTHRFPLDQVEKAVKIAGREMKGDDPIKVVLTP